MNKLKIQNAKFKIIILTLFILQFAFAGAASAMLTIKANHNDIKIDFFYHGSTVSVSGEANSGADLIIKITAPEGRQSLRKKGKVGGMLWMNVGNLQFEHMPNLYFVHSTKNIDEILAPGETDSYVIGYPALKKHVEILPAADENEKSKWFDEFVKFKEYSNLYSTSSGKISTMTKAHGRQEYHILLPWPYQAAPGEYTVTVYAVKDKKVVEEADTRVHVEQVGAIKTLAGVAKNKAALYGILSIGIALGAGFGVGMVFRKGGGSH